MVKAIEPGRTVRRFWHTIGPGLTTGAADDDPSGIATYSQAGAQYGTRFLWMTPFSFPLMAVVQEICARIGQTTRKGLSANIRQYFPKSIIVLTTTLLIVANVFNLDVDLGVTATAVRLVVLEIPFPSRMIGFAALSLIPSGTSPQSTRRLQLNDSSPPIRGCTRSDFRATPRDSTRMNSSGTYSNAIFAMPYPKT